MQHVPLAEVTRGGSVESIHYGAVAVVDTTGKLLFSAGNPDFQTFTRSTLKPLQAYPFLRDGGAERFALTMEEIAMMCASHSGETMHIDNVKSLLSKAGCTEHQLQCGCHVPGFYAATDTPVPAGKTFDQLYNNCSGKHAGFLACCVQHGYAIENYLELSHPLQQAIRHDVARIAGIDENALKVGIDGCSAPNYAMPLSRLALAYARLVHGSDEVLRTMRDAMMLHPELVSGTARSDLALVSKGNGDRVAKIGAEGVQAIGIPSAGLGIAIKIADGDARPLLAVAASVLRQLGHASEDEPDEFAIRNLKGIPVGITRACVRLQPV